jgi:hypothetical protein
MTLPFLVLASWQLFHGNFKARGRMVILSAIAVGHIVGLAQHHIPPRRRITGPFQRMVLHLWSIEWRDLGGWIETF